MLVDARTDQLVVPNGSLGPEPKSLILDARLPGTLSQRTRAILEVDPAWSPIQYLPG